MASVDAGATDAGAAGCLFESGSKKERRSMLELVDGGGAAAAAAGADVVRGAVEDAEREVGRVEGIRSNRLLFGAC